MTLMSIPTLREKLESCFRDAPVGVSDLTLRDSDLTRTNLRKVEDDLSIKLPPSFANLILTFDFGNLSIGGVFFGNTKPYDRFLMTMNEGQEYPWWGTGSRPSNHLLIAGTDGYVVLLNAESGNIFAYLRDNQWTSRQRIALNFELFVRGCGAVFLEESITDAHKFASSIATVVGGDADSSFWSERVQGTG